MAENLHLLRNAANREIRAENYRGKQRFLVAYGKDKVLTVVAPTMPAAIWAAAKVWQMDPRQAEFHQECRVVRC